MDLATFAADRSQDLDDLEGLLAPAVDEAMDEEDADERLSILNVAVVAAFLAVYAEQGGDEASARADAARLMSDLGPSLRLFDPVVDEDEQVVQRQRMSAWLATATLGAATLFAAESSGQRVTKTWVSMRDDSVREIHRVLDGETVEATGLFSVKSDPPTELSYPGQPVGPPEAWINCVAESSQIAWTGQDVLGSTRRDYSGPLVDLVTEDGHRLTVTPNHPVLTTRGYVDAGVLAPGDQVLATPQPVTPEVADAPPSAKEFHSAASKLWSKQRVRGSRMDFHGDGTENEVEVVRPHGDLATPTGEPSELVFVGTSVGQSLLGGSRAPEQPGSGVGVLAPTPTPKVANLIGSQSLVGSEGVGPSFSRGHALHPQPVGLGTTALDEPEFLHASLDSSSIDAESLAHLQDADAIGMKPSKLIEVNRYTGTTFVHNLHTSRNHYSANGIQVHNCRCVLLVDSQPLVAAAGQFTGALIVALPEGDDTVTYKDGDTTELHQTLAWFGDSNQLSAEQRADIVLVAEALASMSEPFEARVAGLATLGDDQDEVAITESVELQALRDMIVADERTGMILEQVEQHPTWISHVTSQGLSAGDTVRFDRIAAWFGDDRATFDMGTALSAAAGPESERPDVTPVESENVPVWGVAAPEGAESGDGRMFSVGSLSWRDLPVPLTWQRSDIGQHDGKVVVGRLDTLERRADNLVYFTGELLTSVPETDEVIDLIAQGALRGVSVDADKGVAEQDPDEVEAAAMEGRAPLTTITKARISGLTIVQIPAFQEAFIRLGYEDETEAQPVVEDETFDGETSTFKRGPGWVTNPKETKTLHDYWTKGEGAAKIGWGTNGDWTRCTRYLREHIEPRFLKRTCAEWHHDALGYWPGELGKPGNPPKRTASNECTDCEDQTMVAASASPAMTLVAAAPPEVVPFDAFQDPKFSGPTPLTIVGRSVFGHLATWGVCHIGISGECVTAPHSKRDYSDFHLGSIMTDQGELAVGTITMGTGHADMNFTATDTRHHYDHTGTAVAKVRAGEDEHGIWVAGIILDGVSDEQVRTLQSSGGLSGDWRSIGRSLELVAALAVNVPGFPVPRTSVAASAERTTSLVAAGVLVQEDRDRTDEIATAVIKQLDRRDRRKQKLAALEDTTRMARRKKIEDHGL